MSKASSNRLTNNLSFRYNKSYGSVNPVMSAEVDIEHHASESINNFYLTWDNVSVQVSMTSTFKKDVKTLLNNVNGSIKSGTMTGLLGPSGAGKTTLLYALCNGLNVTAKGDILLNTVAHPDDFRIGFVPQHDNLYDIFTVRETILFASRLQNKNLSDTGHEERVNEVLEQLDLISLKDKTLDKLSDGEKKRTSIATELVSNPKILFLDEPTSNLDSSNALNVVSILKDLCDSGNGPAILISVHQPSKDILFLFHFVYLLSKGEKLYHGPPEEVMSFLRSYGYEGSENGNSDNVNPAEFMIEVAKDPWVSEKFNDMLTTSRNSRLDNGIIHCTIRTPMGLLKQRKARSPFVQIWIIMIRIFKTQVTRRPFNTIIQMVLGSFVGLLISYLAKEPVGPRPLCVDLNPNPVSQLKSLNEITEAFTLYYMLIIHTTFSFAMTACMTFSQELNIVSKEVANSWYSIYSYYLSKLVSDAILVMVTFLPMFLVIYFCTQQPHSLDRGVKFFFICCASGFLWQAWAQFFSIICGKNTQLTVMVVITLMIPMYLLSGVFIKVNAMSGIPKALSWISDTRFAIEGLLIAIYDGRCDHLPPLGGLEDMIPTKSAIFNFFTINGSQEVRDLLILVAHVCISKSLFLLGLVGKIWFRRRL